MQGAKVQSLLTKPDIQIKDTTIWSSLVPRVSHFTAIVAFGLKFRIQWNLDLTNLDLTNLYLTKSSI